MGKNIYRAFILLAIAAAVVGVLFGLCVGCSAVSGDMSQKPRQTAAVEPGETIAPAVGTQATQQQGGLNAAVSASVAPAVTGGQNAQQGVVNLNQTIAVPLSVVVLVAVLIQSQTALLGWDKWLSHRREMMRIQGRNGGGK